MDLFLCCSMTNVPNKFFNNYSKTISNLHSFIESFGHNVSNALRDNSPYDSSLDDFENAKVCYEWHKSRIEKSNLVIAEVSFPSIGVGIELESANQFNIPIILIYDKILAIKADVKEYEATGDLIKNTNITHPNISSMALGLKQAKELVGYKDFSDLSSRLRKYLA